MISAQRVPSFVSDCVLLLCRALDVIVLEMHRQLLSMQKSLIQQQKNYAVAVRPTWSLFTIRPTLLPSVNGNASSVCLVAQVSALFSSRRY